MKWVNKSIILKVPDEIKHISKEEEQEVLKLAEGSNAKGLNTYIVKLWNLIGSKINEDGRKIDRISITKLGELIGKEILI